MVLPVPLTDPVFGIDLFGLKADCPHFVRKKFSFLSDIYDVYENKFLSAIFIGGFFYSV
jgi:hypothetical protein